MERTWTTRWELGLYGASRACNVGSIVGNGRMKKNMDTAISLQTLRGLTVSKYCRILFVGAKILKSSKPKPS